LSQEGAAVEAAVKHAVAAGRGTTDIGGSLGTTETGDAIAACLEKNQQ
jgi:isocitrate/isopropylmalate dehydrogenase